MSKCKKKKKKCGVLHQNIGDANNVAAVEEIDWTETTKEGGK